ncbi:WD-REPEATS-REGION domain-containing protein [Aphelenchoides besseyi]|nr:WD-REPEATS-REGION domain-containing protein [Aphelenchoides besseyi]
MSKLESNRQKSFKKRELTPSRNHDVRTGERIAEGDRYVGICSEEQLQIAQHLIKTDESASLENKENVSEGSPHKDSDYERKMNAMRQNDDGTTTVLQIMSYRRGCAPRPGAGHRPRTTGYTCVQPSSSVKKTTRYMPKSPKKILDAPTLRNDYYLGLMDWSRGNIVAVALDSAVYLWNAQTGDVTELAEYNGLYVSSVRYSEAGRYLTIGLSDGTLQVYKVDASGGPMLARTIKVGLDRVNAIAWKGSLVSCGSENGRIYTHDVRQRESLQGVIEKHNYEVTAMKWSPDGHYLTSGGAQGQVHVFTDTQIGTTRPEPIYSFDDHVGCIKAVEYVPFLSGSNSRVNMVATGGGTSDNTVRLWNLSTGKEHISLDVGSRVSGLAFNNLYREMCVATAGPRFALRFFKYGGSSFQPVNDIDGHTANIVGLCVSPEGDHVLSLSMDESLRLWHCWKVDESVKEAQGIGKMSGLRVGSHLQIR